MTTHNFNGNRPEASGGAKGEVVTSQASVSSLKAFAERLNKSIPKAYNIHINEDRMEITMYVNNVFVILEPQLESNGELIYTPITIKWFNDQLKPIGELYVSSKEIVFEDEYKTLTCKYEEIGEDPIMLIDEKELIEYLNELSKISDYEEFKQFAESEFLSSSGLQP